MVTILRSRFAIWIALIGCAFASANAGARDFKVAIQYGLTYLPLMIMKEDKLIEKHARTLGVENLNVEWDQFASGSVMNDALLSESLDIVPASVSAYLTLWSKTVDTPNAVIGLCALNSLPLFLNTRDPRLKSVKDLSTGDKIALPAVKVSTFAIALQMEAAKLYGDDNYNRFDKFTVSMSHPDAMAALLSGAGEVSSHFTSPPFNFLELEDPKIRTILDARTVFGGPVSFAMNYTTVKFYKANPKLVAAFLAAFKEATDQINSDKRKAAQRYVALSKSKASADLVEKILRHPDTDFTLTPQGSMRIATFMHRIGSIQNAPNAWRDLFIPEIRDLPGS